MNRVPLFGMKPRPNPEVAAIGALRGRRKSIKTSTKDQIKRSFHEMKGTIKEEVGKVTSDRNLKAELKAEKKAGTVQQRIGDAKEAVPNLKGQLAELKNWIGHLAYAPEGDRLLHHAIRANSRYRPA